jgi:hypothetical protein
MMRLPFRQGTLLPTKLIRSWTPRARQIAQSHEERIVFTDFYDDDEGRSRQYVCECATAEQAAFIVEACNAHQPMLNLMSKVRRIVMEGRSDPATALMMIDAALAVQTESVAA